MLVGTGLHDAGALRRHRDRVWSLGHATHELLDAALALGGSYYLTFDLLASIEQFRRAYPRADEFFALKRQHDPNRIFSSMFFQKYGGH
ncbi:MAG: hypothetical protein QOE14_1886 [Humisphaera sp.]|nr:hypothetical protein [Humisphaera sp.]